MITNFDAETAPLNELELKAAYIIAKTLNAKNHGRDTAITGDVMARGMANTFDAFRTYDKEGHRKPYLNGSRMRKVINHIRTTGMAKCLLATNNGYYISDDPCEVRDYLRSLKEREEAIHQVYDAIKRQAMEKFPDEPAILMEIK